MRRDFQMMWLSFAEIRGRFAIIRLFVSVQIKDTSMERRGWFAITWLFMSVKINIWKTCGIFNSDWCWCLWYFCVHRIFSRGLWGVLFYYLHCYSHCCYWCERVHDTGQVKGFCNFTTLEKDISRLQWRGQWYPWDFFRHGAWSLDQQVSCYILYP